MAAYMNNCLSIAIMGFQGICIRFCIVRTDHLPFGNFSVSGIFLCIMTSKSKICVNTNAQARTGYC